MQIQRLNHAKSFPSVETAVTDVTREHAWVIVQDPSRHKVVLQACDRCGVVKSENSVVRACRGDSHTKLITSIKVANMLRAV